MQLEWSWRNAALFDASLYLLAALLLGQITGVQEPKRLTARRWAICITGQLSRLEVESKIENLFASLSAQDEAVEVFVVLERNASVFAYPETNGGASECSRDGIAAEQLPERLRPWYKAGRFVEHKNFTGELVLDYWPEFQRHWPDWKRLQVLANDVSQMTHMKKCAELILENEQSEEVGMPYTDVMRIRDNGIVVLPFRAKSVRREGIAVKSTNGNMGVNDRVLYASRSYLSPAFTGPRSLAALINVNGSDPESRRVYNSEMLLAKALQPYPLSRLPPDELVVVDGRCRAGRKFCLVPKIRDEPPRTWSLWPPRLWRLWAPSC